MCLNRRQALFPNPENGGKRTNARSQLPELLMTARKAVCLMLALAACSPPVPDSAAGVGFDNYPEYLRRQDALRGQQAAGVAPTDPVFSTEAVGAAIDASDGTRGAAPGAPIDPFAGGALAQPAGVASGAGDYRPTGAVISDEQDFDAVAARETIESDKERLARQKAQYEVVAPKALPQRDGAAEPNIVAYALATQHNPGTPLYNRSTFFAKDTVVACARYTSADLAQEAFLAAGGPEKDREGLDPDGDGFVCGWDPRPFRTALR
jgi:hypothetical protein